MKDLLDAAQIDECCDVGITPRRERARRSRFDARSSGARAATRMSHRRTS